MALSNSQKNALYASLQGKGYDTGRKVGEAYSPAITNLSDEELLALAAYENQAESDRRKSQMDRADTNEDFKSQLAQLTGSKQRQAEQAGRIQEGVMRTQGLAGMMSNF